MSFGREGPDLGPVGSPWSPASSPASGPGACQNEKRTRRRECPFGDRAPPGKAGNGRGPAAGRRSLREGLISAGSDCTAYFFFTKYLFPVGSGPDVRVVAEERRALLSSCLQPCKEGWRSPFASLFRSNIGTSESSTVLGKGCEEKSSKKL